MLLKRRKKLCFTQTAPLSEKPRTEHPESRLSLFPKLIETNGTEKFCTPTFEVEDFILCCRYLYYCRNILLISDELYDLYEKAWMRYHPKSNLFQPGSDKETDYSPHIRSLGLYFAFKLAKKEPAKKLLIRKR